MHLVGMKRKLIILKELLDEKYEKIPEEYREDAIDVYENLSMKYKFLGIPEIENKDINMIEAFIIKLREL